MLVPSKTANGPPALGSVAERIWPPGAPTSGFSRWPKAVRPAEEKLVTTPPRPVDEIARAAADPDRRAAAPAGEEGAELLAVEVGDHPAADVELDRDRVRLARPVVDDHDADAAGGLHAGALEREGAGAAGDERDRAVQRAAGERARAAVEVAGRAAEVARHRLAVRAEDRADVDDRLIRAWPRRPESPGRRCARRGSSSAARACPVRSRRAPARRRASSRAPRPRSRRGRCRASRPSRPRSRRGRCRPRSPGRRLPRRRSAPPRSARR